MSRLDVIQIHLIHEYVLAGGSYCSFFRVWRVAGGCFPFCTLLLVSDLVPRCVYERTIQCGWAISSICSSGTVLRVNIDSDLLAFYVS